MKLLSAEFIKSAALLNQVPQDNKPHIAIVGRSNVGKSSLLNVIMNRRRLALTSSRPGKTRLINFFLINDLFYLVDLPGYGFSKASKKEQQHWQSLIESYLKSIPQLKLIILLIDIRHPMSPLDYEMLEWLAFFNHRVIVIGTKADKLSSNQLVKQITYYKKALSPFQITEIYSFSSITRKGKNEVWQAISSVIS
jgi:GTP-binding protein